MKEDAPDRFRGVFSLLGACDTMSRRARLKATIISKIKGEAAMHCVAF